MADTQQPIRNISDTALWAAVYRARESDRPDAVFRDPLAQRLAGARGEQIAAAMPSFNAHTWTWATRTYLFDHFINRQINAGADMVVNLAAGLDARPYRMRLPASLRWVEIDLPDLLAYKQEILSDEKPACRLERIALDLTDVQRRRDVFDQLGRRAKHAVVVSEGLIIYIPEPNVAVLAQDLARTTSFREWITDLVSPALLRVLQQRLGSPLSQAGAPLVFGPADGFKFFAQHGWTLVDARSMLKTAAKLKRLSFMMRLVAMLPESERARRHRPWGGICLFQKT